MRGFNIINQKKIIKKYQTFLMSINCLKKSKLYQVSGPRP